MGGIKERKVEIRKGYSNKNQWTIDLDEKQIASTAIASADLSAAEREPIQNVTSIACQSA